MKWNLMAWTPTSRGRESEKEWADRFQLLSFYKVNLMALNNVTNGSLNFGESQVENAFSIAQMCPDVSHF